MSYTFRIITLGCKVNQCESAYLEEVLAAAGWVPAPEGARADVSIINTCIVTRTAAHQSRQAVRKAVRENPGGKVAAIGCYAQVFPEELLSIEGLGIIAGNASKGRVPEFLLEGVSSDRRIVATGPFRKGMALDRMPLKQFPGRTRSFVKIQDGCESFCSYCAVPFARGPCRSLPPGEVLSMLDSLARSGYREAVLTGIHLGKYGADLNGATNLPALLREIGGAGLPMRIRLSSLEPNEIGQDLIEMTAAERWLCPHFHIPLQSGDDRVLERMNRRYGAHEFSRLVETIHGRIPYAAIGVDVMCGFAGESNAAHRNTLSLIKDLPVSYLHVFPYSRRKGTAAYGFDSHLDSEVVKYRAAEMRAIGKEKRLAFYKRCLGKHFEVLAEGRDPKAPGFVKGTSDNYLPVRFEAQAEITNQLLEVRMDRIAGNVVEGSVSVTGVSSRTFSRATEA